MSAPASCLHSPREPLLARLFHRLFCRLRDGAATGRRAGLASAHESELEVLAAYDAHRRAADPPPPTPEDVRDAYRLWFGSDRNRFL